MKYVLLNDILYFFRSKKKIIYMYIAILFSYFLFNILLEMPMDNNLFYKVLTLNCEFEISEWMNIIIYVFSISTYICIAFVLFTKDLKNGLTNIFLRMKAWKWIFCKSASIFLVSTTLLLGAYLIVFIPYLIAGISVKISIMLFIKHLVYLLLLQSISLLLFVISSKWKILLPVTILLILINIYIIPTNITNVDFGITITLFVLICALLIGSYRYLYVSVFENS